jgi:hypothetical protein
MFIQKESKNKMIQSRFVKIPLITLMTILGFSVVVILLILSIIGLIGGALREIFSNLNPSQGFSVKSASRDPDPINALVTQE